MSKSVRIDEPHEHHLQYLLKTDNTGAYEGRVLQVPSIIVQGVSREEIDKKIATTTYNYLTHFKDDHERVLNDSSPILVDSGYGTILETKQFIVKC